MKLALNSQKLQRLQVLKLQHSQRLKDSWDLSHLMDRRMLSERCDIINACLFEKFRTSRFILLHAGVCLRRWMIWWTQT
jgi:hypothetical protein